MSIYRIYPKYSCIRVRREGFPAVIRRYFFPPSGWTVIKEALFFCSLKPSGGKIRCQSQSRAPRWENIHKSRAGFFYISARELIKHWGLCLWHCISPLKYRDACTSCHLKYYFKLTTICHTTIQEINNPKHDMARLFNINKVS